MSVWGELLVTYALNVLWLGAVLGGAGWLAARCLRGFGPAVVCWVWRAAILATALVPLLTLRLVAGEASGVAIADGSGERAQWVWPGVALICAACIVWRAVRLVADWRAVTRLRSGAVPRPAPAWVLRVLARFRGPAPVLLAGEKGAAYTAGWRRPMLVLPERYLAAELPGAESILGHELAPH